MKKPIFIVGTGRCGSTLFHDLMCNSTSLYWLTQYANKYPGQLGRNAMLMKFLDWPVLNSVLRKKLWPAEPYRFWESHCPGFATPFRDLVKEDVTPRVKDHLVRTVPKAFPDEKNRALFKITGWPRIGLLKEIWPDAQFVHIVRDGRAVVNSVISAPYFDGWKGPGNWCRGELSPAQEQLWRAHNRSFVALAAFGWENRMEAFRTAAAAVNDCDYIEVKYEDLCLDPPKALATVFDFCGLPWSTSFADFIAKYAIRNTNDKFTRELSPQQQVMLNECLAASLQKWGYDQ